MNGTPAPSQAGFPALPASDARARPTKARTPQDDGLNLVYDHGGALAALGLRSRADFRLVPVLAHQRADLLVDAFTPQEAPPPSLLAELAPLLSPRLERLYDHLRQRLARTRRMTSVGRVRQLDTACLRHAARRPGRTLLEKAGPKQTLLAVQRVARFDTMENRILKHVASRIERSCGDTLRSLSDAARKHPRTQQLRRLRRAAAAIAQHPDLAAVGSPRPGERPSNALLGDKDYRAAWRASLLLRQEEDRFREEWLAMPTLWSELSLFALWATLDRAQGLIPVPAPLRVLERREGGRRLSTDARTWVQEDALGQTHFHVARRGDALVLTRERRRERGAAVSSILFPTRLVPSDRLRSKNSPATSSTLVGYIASRCVALGLRLRDASPQAIPAPSKLVGLCALHRRLHIAGDQGVEVGAPVAAAMVSVPGEKPLNVSGLPATLLPEVVGPARMHAEELALLGQLLQPHLGREETAVVVPDAADDVALLNLRRALGPVWAVWSPVAAALAAAASHPEVFPVREDPHPRTVLVVVRTPTALDMCLLEEAVDPAKEGRSAQRVWIRSAPLRTVWQPDEARLPAGALGAWLRATPNHPAWYPSEEDGTLRSIHDLPPAAIHESVQRLLATWSGDAPTACILVGVGPADLTPDTAHLPSVSLPATALAGGAKIFLQRHRAGLPTWRDRLPHVQLAVASDALTQALDIIPKGRVVSPGEQISHTCDQPVSLRHGQASIRLPFTVDQQPSPHSLVIEGPPLPLAAPTKVRVRVDYRHGREGLQGVLLAHGAHAPFERMPFCIGSGEANSADTVKPKPVPRPQHGRFGADHMEALRSAVEALEVALRYPAGKQPKASKKKKQGRRGDEDPILTHRDAFNAVKDTLRATLTATGPDVLDEALRDDLVDAARSLDWLLGVRQRKIGRPPVLNEKQRTLVVQTRSRFGVRGELDDDMLLSVPDLSTRLRCIGRLIDGRADTLWEHLVNADSSNPTWAGAIAGALSRHRGLPEALSEEAAQSLLSRLLDGIESEAKRDSPRKDAVLGHALALTYLCQVRHEGRLATSSEPCIDAVERLHIVREALPDAVCKHTGRGAMYDGQEPLLTAIAFLRGEYAPLPTIAEG